MYKDVLHELNYDRRVDSSFISRLENNGFDIEYGHFEYWNSQPYLEIGLSTVWLVETYSVPNSGTGVRYRTRNDVAYEIKETIAREQRRLAKEHDLIKEVLPIE